MLPTLIVNASHLGGRNWEYLGSLGLSVKNFMFAPKAGRINAGEASCCPSVAVFNLVETHFCLSSHTSEDLSGQSFTA